MTRILLVDDHPLLREGIAMNLEAEPDLRVVAQADDAEGALVLFDEAEPDLVITDVSLPGMSGLELVKHLLTRRPDLPVLVVSRHDEDLYAERAVRAGARGYVSKVAGGRQIVDGRPARPPRRHPPLGGAQGPDALRGRVRRQGPRRSRRSRPSPTASSRCSR